MITVALIWNLELIENHKQVCWIETDEKDSEGQPLVRMNPLTETLIFMTMAVKLGQITEANADEFYARVKFIEALDGPFLTTSSGEPRYFTPEDVHAHIGLGCNVGNETTVKFFTALRRNSFASLKHHYRSTVAQKDSAVA